MEFDFHQRVIVRRSARTITGGTAGLAAEVCWKSAEDGGPILAYAVFLDRLQRIEPGELEAAGE
jgi:NADP-dependent 3-hydroxy acid dehydrogenase YdfG